MFCSKCGKNIDEGTKFCPECGAAVAHEQQTQQAQPVVEPTVEAAGIDQKDINDNKMLCILAYIGILFFIPLVAKPNSKYCRFHANQGLVLFIASTALSIARMIISAILGVIADIVFFGVIFNIVSALLTIAVGVASLVFMVMGIINTVNGEIKELPFIGQYHLIDKDK